MHHLPVAIVQTEVPLAGIFVRRLGGQVFLNKDQSSFLSVALVGKCF